MAKAKRNRKIRVRFDLILLALSMLCYFVTRTYVSAYNVNLSNKYQENQEKILQLTKEGETLQLDVQNLSTYDKIRLVTDNSDLSINTNNVINVGN